MTDLLTSDNFHRQFYNQQIDLFCVWPN